MRECREEEGEENDGKNGNKNEVEDENESVLSENESLADSDTFFESKSSPMRNYENEIEKENENLLQGKIYIENFRTSVFDSEKDEHEIFSNAAENIEIFLIKSTVDKEEKEIVDVNIPGKVNEEKKFLEINILNIENIGTDKEVVKEVVTEVKEVVNEAGEANWQVNKLASKPA